MPVAILSPQNIDIHANVQAALTTGGIAHGAINIDVRPAVSMNSFTNAAATKSFNIVPNIQAALTKGGIVSGVGTIRWTMSGVAALVSPDIIQNQSYQRSGDLGLTVQLQGPPYGFEVPIAALGLAPVIVGGGFSASLILSSYYFPHLVFNAVSSAGVIFSLQRFINKAGTIPQGAPTLGTLTAGGTFLFDNADGKAFGAFQITCTNTSAATATLSSLALVMLSR
jgi:hypothetical protein